MDNIKNIVKTTAVLLPTATIYNQLIIKVIYS